MINSLTYLSIYMSYIYTAIGLLFHLISQIGKLGFFGVDLFVFFFLHIDL